MGELVDIGGLTELMRHFVAEREWSQFHTPKNLAMAMSGEVGELLALMQWLSDDEIRDRLEGDRDFADAVRDELADVLIYLTQLADVLDVDLDDAVAAKMRKNAARYTVKASKGSAEKQPHA